MTLKTPSGEVVETVDGIKLEDVDPNKDYTVIFKEYGKYALSYKVKGFGTIRELITVEDVKRPTLTITDALKTEVAVGTTIKLDATAVDDSGKDTRIVLAVFNADYQMQALEVGSDFTFDKAGKYIVIFTAYDEAGNCTISRNVIKVK